jgi:hypothetical protein
MQDNTNVSRKSEEEKYKCCVDIFILYQITETCETYSDVWKKIAFGKANFVSLGFQWHEENIASQEICLVSIYNRYR